MYIAVLFHNTTHYIYKKIFLVIHLMNALKQYK